MLGISFALRVLVVCQCCAADDSVIRIISARKANPGERRDYEQYWRAAMRRHYDYSGMKGERNPYVTRLKQPITIRLDTATVACFRELAETAGMSYQQLVNLCLRDCVARRRKLRVPWV